MEMISCNGYEDYEGCEMQTQPWRSMPLDSAEPSLMPLGADVIHSSPITTLYPYPT